MFLPRLFLAGVFVVTMPARGQLQDDATPDAKVLDEQIKVFAEARTRKKFEFLQRTRQEVLKPLQTPGAAGNFVIDCMREVQYEGRNGGNAQFAEWKKQNRPMFSDHNFERAATLHLRYLALTLERAPLKSAETLQEELWAYLAALNDAKDLLANVMRDPARVKMTVYDPKEGKVTGQIVGDIQDMRLASADNTRTFVQDMLNQGVNAGLVAQALKLPDHLGQIENWEMSPGNFSGIMEQDVRVYLREKKNPRLLTTWDNEIAFLAAVVDLKKDEKEQEKFRRETYPKLLWKKAEDAELLGMSNRALNIRLDVARKYPEHPDFEMWAAKIQAQLSAIKSQPPKKEGDGFAPIQPLPNDPATPTPTPTSEVSGFGSPIPPA